MKNAVAVCVQHFNSWDNTQPEEAVSEWCVLYLCYSQEIHERCLHCTLSAGLDKISLVLHFNLSLGFCLFVWPTSVLSFCVEIQTAVQISVLMSLGVCDSGCCS